MYKIFLVEDDKTLSKEISERIKLWDYDVYAVSDFRNILQEFEKYSPDLVLLDIMLPFYNGYHWCNEIRKKSDVPVIFISSASDNMNIIMAMNMGGDDFISKPFDADVLIAKIQAVLRRTYERNIKHNIVEKNGMILNLDDMSVKYGDKKIELTKNEFRIFQTLIDNFGKVVSRDTLMLKLWQDDCYVEENTLTVNVTRLRKKLEAIGLKECIRTKIGCGYFIGDEK